MLNVFLLCEYIRGHVSVLNFGIFDPPDFSKNVEQIYLKHIGQKPSEML